MVHCHRRPYESKKRLRQFAGVCQQEERSLDQTQQLIVVSSIKQEPSTIERPTTVTGRELVSPSFLISPSVWNLQEEGNLQQKASYLSVYTLCIGVSRTDTCNIQDMYIYYESFNYYSVYIQ